LLVHLAVGTRFSAIDLQKRSKAAKQRGISGNTQSMPIPTATTQQPTASKNAGKKKANLGRLARMGTKGNNTLNTKTWMEKAGGGPLLQLQNQPHRQS
jgi:hypothetical protein